MKKTILILASVILNLVFILVFVFLQINDSNNKKDKTEYIQNVQQDFDETNKNLPINWPDDFYSKTEFYDNGQVKYQRVVDESGNRKDLHFSYDGKLTKEKIFSNFKPYEEVVYYSSGNRREYIVHESDNVINIITNYESGQLKSKGRKRVSGNGNKMYYGRWVIYNRDGTFQKEIVYN